MVVPKFKAASRPFVSVLHSIRFRLVLWFTFILALVLAAFSGFIYIIQGRDIMGDSIYRLQGKMSALEVTLTVTPGGLLVPPGVLQDTDELVFTDGNGNVLASHGPFPNQDATSLAARALQEVGSLSGVIQPDHLLVSEGRFPPYQLYFCRGSLADWF